MGVRDWFQRRAPRDLAGRRRRVTFVVTYAYATGGVPRAVFAVAGELAERGHEVEVVSVYRTHREPYADVHPAIRLTFLEDRLDPDGGENLPRARRNPARSEADRELDRRPSELVAPGPDAYPAYSALTDRHLRERFAALRPGIVVTTRPELAAAAVRWAPDDVVTVNQEHLTFAVREPDVRAALVGVRDRLDALVTLTDADGGRWARELGDTTTRVVTIPNASSFPLGEGAPLEGRVVIAGGRLTEQKAFDRLIDAFAPVARAHPDWQLHVYGQGRLEGELRAQVERLGLGAQVHLKGFTAEFERRLEEASVYAMSSRYEGFPMVLVEAMTKGVPPVSMDCQSGPRQLIRDGENGLLVPRADVAALSAGIERLVADADLRRRLGAGALATAADYTLPLVVDRWESLLDDLVEARDAAGR
ncbi:glycosyltransferase family 4 protein [Nocardioides sp. SYSU D00038]|uniref:glycosyltransferase family 4 protein n=1 Tax=Nocardioides sp. SYSU D00038 TaxID=2812554 RepID=UPI001967B0CE|nr:glycosyltransferase family 4 protein [Nocardioides sp. SYSU D00038]